MQSFTGKAIKSSLPIITNSAGWLVLLLGSATLLAWTLGVQGSIHELPFWAAMGPLTSISLALFGISLWRLASSDKPDRTGVVLAITIFAVGLLGLVLYYFEFPLSATSNLTRRIFELPPNTALSLTCCGAALVLCDLQPKKCLRSAQALVLVAGLIALLALIGYGYKVPLYQVGSAKPMALSTAAGLLVFCFGFLAARPDRGLTTVLTSNTTGGALARRLLGLAIVIPWCLGALLLAGEKRGHYTGETGLAIFAVLSIIIFTFLIWWNAKLLHFADIKREETEEQLRDTSANLRRSNADLQQFAYLASHDLSEPLRMVISYLQLLETRSGKNLDAQGKEFVGFAVDGALRMQALIKDLLAYSRLGSQSRGFQPVNTEEMLTASLSNLKVAIEEANAVITHDPLPEVWGDPVQIIQVFQNLIANAIKFHGKDPPKIHIGATENGAELQFFVQDNGIGIDPKFFDRIFVIFQRLHTRQEYSGTGMGLAICKKIIEHHGGRIWVESAPGAGATFKFTLPTHAVLK